ncbi:hypothetical protein DACRYDRAFT_110199 [Dacryopinax primogenitus]|uniref:Protein kinase domain-containing protein n=1 Tax=Dacryopinax primogenitus (strain DJM 731) TaxID=1858805 RepID=M5G531_DACPD|nr:uncharacterized protein DACRYDRAFT_110199 [Dacryopinax primogenitus]EJT98862.1 hypothetical protein DACRYDRAFT_110199 [Dacryopinax primogenitus]
MSSDRGRFAKLWREIEPIANAKGYDLNIKEHIEGHGHSVDEYFWLPDKSGMAIPATKDGRHYYIRSMGKDTEEHKCILRLLQDISFEPATAIPIDIFEGPRDRVFMVMHQLAPHWLVPWHTIEDHSMSVAYFMRIVTRMLQNIARLHAAGVAHLDIRPHNVMLDNDGLPVFIDLGVSIVVGDEPNLPLCTTPCPGTRLVPCTTQFGFHAPQRVAEQPFDGRADDVFGVGVFLERCFFATPSQKALLKEILTEFERLLTMMREEDESLRIKAGYAYDQRVKMVIDRPDLLNDEATSRMPF